MKRLWLFIGCLFCIVSGVFAEKEVDTDAKCISMMKVPLEGPDSVFIPALEEVGFVQQHPEDQEPDTYYFAGDFYGGNLESQGSYGIYWFSTRNGGSYMYSLYFDSSNVSPTDYRNRDIGYSVRCIKD